MKILFIDTGAFVGRAIGADQHHHTSTRAWERLADLRTRLVSSEHVLDETATLLARRLSCAYAAEWARTHLESKELTWLSATPDDLRAAVASMRRYADQSVSYTDCISFALMRRERIRHVFGFDHHFEAAGFRRWPGPSMR